MAQYKNFKTKPTAAFALTLLGGILIMLFGVLTFGMGILVSKFSGFMGMMMFGTGVSGVIGIVAGAVIIVGSLLLNTTDRERVEVWSIVVIVLSVVSLLNTGGFLAGFLLALIGGILGLTHS